MIRAGLRLGAFAFLAGACVGPLRELWLAPAIGGLAVAWVEFGLLFAWLSLIAWRAVPGGPAFRHRAVLAVVALALVVACELALGFAFTASGLAASRAPRGLAEQAPGLLLLAWLAALPFLVRR